MKILKNVWQVKPDQSFYFRSKDLVALFLSVTSDWYEDKSNYLFGKKDLVEKAILNWLDTEQDEPLPYEISYALNKFRDEWIDHISGMFENAEGLGKPTDAMIELRDQAIDNLHAAMRIKEIDLTNDEWEELASDENNPCLENF
jgi:hypothetical protein